MSEVFIPLFPWRQVSGVCQDIQALPEIRQGVQDRSAARMPLYRDPQVETAERS